MGGAGVRKFFDLREKFFLLIAMLKNCFIPHRLSFFLHKNVKVSIYTGVEALRLKYTSAHFNCVHLIIKLYRIYGEIIIRSLVRRMNL